MSGLEASIVLKAAAVSLALAACAGCQSSAPEPQQMARTTMQTAPADLQLLCASAVAKQAGASSDKVLPISSRQLDARSYQVELDAAGSRHNCVVDIDGNVTSLAAA